MTNRIPYHTCYNAKCQKLVIYSLLAGYHSDGTLLFVEYLTEFTGKSIRYEKRAREIPINTVTETVVIGSKKRGRPVGYRKPKTTPTQTFLYISA